MTETTPGEINRQNIFTSERIEKVISTAQVPLEHQNKLRDIFELHIKFGGTPKQFSLKAKELTLSEQWDPRIANTIMMLYSNMVNRILQEHNSQN